MIEQVRVELEGIGKLVKAAGISDEDKRIAGWCRDDSGRNYDVQLRPAPPRG